MARRLVAALFAATLAGGTACGVAAAKAERIDQVFPSGLIASPQSAQYAAERERAKEELREEIRKDLLLLIGFLAQTLVILVWFALLTSGSDKPGEKPDETKEKKG